MTDGDADMRKDTMRSAPDPHLPDWADRLLSELHGIKEALGGLEIAVSTQATLIDAEDVDGLGILLRKRSGLIDSMAASSERVAPLIECFQREDAARMGRRAERIQRLMDEIRRSLDVVLAHDREAEESIAGSMVSIKKRISMTHSESAAAHAYHASGAANEARFSDRKA